MLQAPVQVALDDGRVDVALAAYRAGVAQLTGDRLYGLRHILASARRRLWRRQAPQRAQAKERPCPRAEILAGELRTRSRLQVSVDVRGFDRVSSAALVEVLEELFARQVLHAAHDPRDAPVGKGDFVQHPALSLEAQPKRGATDLRLALAQGRKTEGVVVAGILGIADAHERCLEQANDRGDHLLARQPWPRKIARDPPANARQGAGESGEPPVLRLVAQLAPALVIAILLASSCVAPGRLDMALRARADPYLRPGRRDGEPSNSLKRRSVVHRGAGRGDIAKPSCRSAPLDTGHAIADIAQARGPGGLGRRVRLSHGLAHRKARASGTIRAE